LIELIIVLLIVVLILGMAAPRIDLGRIRVDTSAMRVSTYLLAAQRMAVTKQHDVRVLFDEAERALVIHEDANNDGIQDPGERLRTERLDDGIVFGLGDDPLSGDGAALTFALGDEGVPTLTYRRNGSASEEGAAHLTALPAGRLTYDRAVHVTRATGLTRCWSRASEQWKEGC
jgi:type II secretory pathway pseudopilin PulG